MKRLLSIVILGVSSLCAAEFPAPATDVSLAPQSSKETAVFAGGCFWGVEGVFERVKGVSKAESGFAGGRIKNPSYERVSTGTTGHAESVRVTYDPSKITYGQLLTVFFAVVHDPTQLNRQGPDTGTQYRSAIFYMNDDQKRVAEAYIKQLDDAHIYGRPIVTQVAPYTGFYMAEPYHQHFLDQNPDYPYIVHNDLPKIETLKKHLPELCRR
jgi:peptide-methionine (S)-S-oxide reductase